MKNMMAAFFLLLMSIWLLLFALVNSDNATLWSILSVILFVVAGVCFYKSYFGKGDQ